MTCAHWETAILPPGETVPGVCRRHPLSGTYLAGGYNRLKTKIADRDIENESGKYAQLAVSEFRFPEGGQWLSPENTRPSVLLRELDIQNGFSPISLFLKTNRDAASGWKNSALCIWGTGTAVIIS